MENKAKITTKTYYVCGECKKKMETLNLGSSSDFMSSLFSTAKHAMYCGNSECKNFGLLTVVGIKKEE